MATKSEDILKMWMLAYDLSLVIVHRKGKICKKLVKYSTMCVLLV